MAYNTGPEQSSPQVESRTSPSFRYTERVVQLVVQSWEASHKREADRAQLAASFSTSRSSIDRVIDVWESTGPSLLNKLDLTSKLRSKVARERDADACDALLHGGWRHTRGARYVQT